MDERLGGGRVRKNLLAPFAIGSHHFSHSESEAPTGSQNLPRLIM